jgi:tubulin--tyrosine ligase
MDQRHTFFSGESGFSIYVALGEALAKRGDWRRETKTAKMKYCDVILGDRFDIPYHLLKEGSKKLLINYFKGSHKLTLKASMAQVLRGVEGSASWLPVTFAIGGKDAEKSEQSEFEAYCTEYDSTKAAQQARKSKSGVEPDGSTVAEPATPLVWIVKPSSGCKGQGVHITKDWKDVLRFIAESGNGRYVTQTYIERPLLIHGRKFDIRVWALLTSPFDIYVFRQGSCRTASVKYDLGNLDSIHSHLTNHCLQESSADFGKYEEGNEMWYDQLDAYLQSVGSSCSVRRDLEPQMDHIIKESLLAVKDLLEVSDCYRYRCFQLFGYDFIVDERMKVHLLEINGSPGAADKWLNDVVDGIVQLCIDPTFPPHQELISAKAGGGKSLPSSSALPSTPQESFTESSPTRGLASNESITGAASFIEEGMPRNWSLLYKATQPLSPKTPLQGITASLSELTVNCTA